MIQGHHERGVTTLLQQQRKHEPQDTKHLRPKGCARVVLLTAPGGGVVTQGTTKILKTWQPSDSVNAYLWELLEWASVDLDQPLNKGLNEYAPAPPTCAYNQEKEERLGKARC